MDFSPCRLTAESERRERGGDGEIEIEKERKKERKRERKREREGRERRGVEEKREIEGEIVLNPVVSVQEVLGRCTVDIRVCASPGRDRDVDEKRLRGEDTDTGPPDPSNKPAPPSTRRGRKRGME